MQTIPESGAPGNAIGPAERVAIACRACGATSDLVVELRHIGGRPNPVEVVSCRNLRECARRQDGRTARAA